MSRSDRAGVAEWLQHFAAAQRDPDALDAFAERVGEAMGRRFPDVLADPLLYADLNASTRAHWERFLTLEPSPGEQRLPRPVEDFAVAVARHGRDLTFLLKVYVEGRAIGWEMFTDIVRALPDDGPDRAELLMSMWDRANALLDGSLEHVIATYAAERRRLDGGVAAERATLVERLLTEDRGVDPERAGATLGHPLHLLHTAALMWSDDGHGATAFDDAAARVATMLGAGAPLVVQRGRTAWCWFATTTLPDLTLLPGEHSVLGSDHVRAAFGTTARGPHGFRASHLEAVAAHRVAVAGPGGPPVTLYTDVELVAMLRSIPQEAAAFVRRVLGGLADDDRGNAGLRETLLAVLEADGDLRPVSAAMHVHRNTLRYRLAKAEERLGYRIGERRADLTVALRYLRSVPQPRMHGSTAPSPR
jgi:PucR-like helix-turn-helix protein/diguanylate cyclase with GGDEF domain